MIISEDTMRVVSFLSEISGNNLRKSNDFAAILEIGAANSLSELINSLTFNGASIWKLHRLLKKSDLADENTAKLLSEFKQLVIDFTALLDELMKYADEPEKKRFSEIYLATEQHSLLNIIDLARDLYEFKNLQSDMKNKKIK